jgi:hypothetical protein
VQFETSRRNDPGHKPSERTAADLLNCGDDEVLKEVV